MGGNRADKKKRYALLQSRHCWTPPEPLPAGLRRLFMGRDDGKLRVLSKQMARYCLIMPTMLAIAGCAGVRPDIPEPTVAIPADWTNDGADSASAPIAVDPGAYWRRLGDPLLTHYVEQAIIANRDLAQSAARLDQARSTLRQARARFLPNVTTSAGATRDLGDLRREGVPISAGVDASWEADLFGHISNNVAASRADLLAAGYGLADLQRLVVGQVALATIEGRAIAAQLAIARDTLAYQDENLQIARWRVQAGLVSSLDVEQARTQRAQTAATIPALESALAANGNAISTLIGEPPGAVLAQFQADGAGVMPQPVELAGFAPPAGVLRRRPDVRGAEESLVAATARIGVARAQLLPLVRLTGNIGPGTATLGNLFDTVTGGLFAGVTQLIFDGGAARAGVEGAEAAARGALAAWEQSILTALEEVESAAADRRAAGERVLINEEAVDAASNSAILARSEYQAGLTDFRTLLTAESQLLSARNQLVSAEADRAGAFVRLAQALGGGWVPEDFAPLADNRTGP